MKDIKYDGLLAVAFILMLVGACKNPKGPIFLEPPDSPDLFSPEQLQCVQLADTDNRSLDVITAAKKQSESRKFVNWLLQMDTLDPLVFSAIQDIGNGQVTIFLPTNLAVDQFLDTYNHVELTDEKRVALVRHHILTQWFGWEDLLENMRRPRTINEAELIYWKNETYCGFVGKDTAQFMIADDECRNGVLHVINKVRVPEGFE